MIRPAGLIDEIWRKIEGKGFKAAVSSLSGESQEYLITFFEKAKHDSSWGGDKRDSWLDHIVFTFENTSENLSVEQCRKIIEIADAILNKPSHQIIIKSTLGELFEFQKLAFFQSEMIRAMISSGVVSSRPIMLGISGVALEVLKNNLPMQSVPEDLPFDKSYELLKAADVLQMNSVKSDVEKLLKQRISFENEGSFKVILGVAQEANSFVLQTMCMRQALSGISGAELCKNISPDKKCHIKIACDAFSQGESVQNSSANLDQQIQDLLSQLSQFNSLDYFFEFSGSITPELIEPVFKRIKQQITEVTFCATNEMDESCYSSLGNLKALKGFTFLAPSNGKDGSCYKNLTDEVIRNTLKRLPLESVSFSACHSITAGGVASLRLKRGPKVTIESCNSVAS